HPAGDQMLVRVAGAIRDSLRGCDTASRYGGDEFAVILPDTDARAARLVAERICDKVGASDAPIKVTVSGGLADLSLAARVLPKRGSLRRPIGRCTWRRAAGATVWPRRYCRVATERDRPVSGVPGILE